MKIYLSRIEYRAAARRLFLTLSLLGLVAAARGAAIPEPETVFFGRVLARSGGQDQVVKDGALVWVVSTTGDQTLSFETRLESLADGAYSYLLKIPHEAASLGLDPSSDAVVTLGSTAASHGHLSITVDGRPATIVIPGGGSFSTEQLLRAQTLRLDLRVDLDQADSDGDGIDDWWEDANGFDKQLASDAELDGDGDGLTNHAEFLGGTNPNLNNSAPELLTGELLVYADGTTGVLLQTADTDSAPGELTYTVSALPVQGTLQLHEPETTVAVGSTFTQDDLNRGRLVYVHEGVETGTRPAFQVVVRDEDPLHAASAGTVTLNVFRSAETGGVALDDSPQRLQRDRNLLLSRDGGYTIWDLFDAPTPRHLDLSGSERAQVIAGGFGDDDLTGGAQADILVGSAGDDTLHGGPGADVFVLLAPDQGNDTVADFHPDEGDAIDLTLALDGTSTLATDYLVVSGTSLGIDLNGDGSGFTDVVVSLPDNQFGAGDLRRLIDGGNLILDGIGLPPVVLIEATLASANENDPASPGVFTITRSGSTAQPLSVQLTIGGSATNGVDYSLLGSGIQFAPGQRSLMVLLRPFVDSIPEPNEVVEIRIATGTGYEVGSAARAQLAIIDLMPQIAIEALEGLAVESSASPGAILVSRSGVYDRSVLVRLTIAGTAMNGTDYNTLSPFLNLAAGQTSAILEIVPKDAGVAIEGAESVVLTVKQDPGYFIHGPAAAQVVIVDDVTRYESYLGGAPDTPERFSAYAFQAGAGGPSSGISGGFLRVEVNRNWAATDIEYTAEVSSDLKSWRTGPALVTDVTPVALTARQVNRQVFQSTQPVVGGAKLFMRVRAARK
ncbi:MAG: hypothetical protein K9N23_07525 [Akkermansiaceae bacterium]|nr:hypothetical protein [Akkermansiaceae bacterium]